MKIFHLETLDRIERETVLALGFFDGLHKGHRVIIENVVKIARKENLAPALFTFRRHPHETFHTGICFPYLATAHEKKCLAEILGIKYYVDVDFTREFSETPAVEFIEKILIEKLRGRVFVMGHDYHFGNKAKGDVNLLRKSASKYDSRVVEISEIKLKGQRIASTWIREAILVGDITWANKALGRWYSIDGKVQPGSKRGSRLGIPTANLELPEDKVMPRPGVYCVFVLFDGKLYRGVGHVGHKPTFDEHHYNIEIHLFNFSSNIYGEHIRVFFLKHIRDTIKFKDAGQMIDAISRDISKCHKCLDKISSEEIMKNTLICPEKSHVKIVSCGHENMQRNFKKEN